MPVPFLHNRVQKHGIVENVHFSRNYLSFANGNTRQHGFPIITAVDLCVRTTIGHGEKQLDFILFQVIIIIT